MKKRVSRRDAGAQGKDKSYFLDRITGALKKIKQDWGMKKSVCKLPIAPKKKPGFFNCVLVLLDPLKAISTASHRDRSPASNMQGR